MKTRIRVAAVIMVAFVLGVAVGAWYALRHRPAAVCEIDGRPIHAHMRTLADVNGERLFTCCPRCPLTLASQAGAKVKILEVTDYVSGHQISASRAYFVDGSDVETCSTPRVRPEGEPLPYERLFDRCAPSLIAFSREDQAREFMGVHGGTLKQLDQLMRDAATGRPTTEGTHHD